MSATPLLEARDLHYAYPGSIGGSRGAPVLRGVSLSLHAGQVVALLGANGSGKSTLLRLMLGLLVPNGGTVCLDGRRLTHFSRRAAARRIAYVPQSHTVPFPYQVRDLVTLGRIPRTGLFRNLSLIDRAAVDAALQRLGIGHLANRPFTELSGGERQLCLIARALVQEAQIILMDEPVTGLDFGNQWRLLDLIRELAAEGRILVTSTHYPDHALNAADRVVLLHGGRLLADGLPETVVTPATIRTLYGIEVSIHRLPGGRLALVPALAGRPITRPTTGPGSIRAPVTAHG